MKISQILRSVLCGAALAVTVATVPAQAEPVKIRFPGEYSATLLAGVANTKFAKYVSEASKGEITVEFYFDGSLYKGTDLLQAVLRGDVEMSTLIEAYWPAISRRLLVFEMPYAFPSHDVLRKAVEDDAFLKEAYAEVEQKGGVVLGVLPHQYLVPGTTNPVRAYTDLKGLRLRSLGEVNSETLEAWGATPVSLNFVEVVPALQQGMIEGMNVPLEVYTGLKLYDVIKNIDYATYSITFFPWIVNKAWWEGLSEENRTIIRDAVKRVVAEQWDYQKKNKEDSFRILREHGVDIHEQTVEEQKAWRAVVQPVWDKHADEIGESLLAKVKSFQD